MESLLIVSRFLSYTVVGMSVFMKLPQITAIFMTGNTKGVNLKTYWLESGSYLISFSYGYTHGYHISTYVETVLLVIQSAAIIVLVIYYDKKWTLENALYTSVALGLIVPTLMGLIPHFLLSILLSLTLPLAVFSKLTQITTIYQIKSRGNVSILTWSLAAYGCFARLFTVYVELGDMQIFFNFFVSSMLNAVVVIMCFYYGDELQKKEE